MSNLTNGCEKKQPYAVVKNTFLISLNFFWKYFFGFYEMGSVRTKTKIATRHRAEKNWR